MTQRCAYSHEYVSLTNGSMVCSACGFVPRSTPMTGETGKGSVLTREEAERKLRLVPDLDTDHPFVGEVLAGIADLRAEMERLRGLLGQFYDGRYGDNSDCNEPDCEWCVLRRETWPLVKDLTATMRGPRCPHEARVAEPEDESRSYSDEADLQLRERSKAEARVAELEKALPLIPHLHRQRAFSEKTFGPGARTAGVLDHIRKELIEIERASDDLSEWIDVVILAFDGAWRAGHSPEEITAALVAKQTTNELRAWPDWHTAEPGKAIEHVKEGR